MVFFKQIMHIILWHSCLGTFLMLNYWGKKCGSKQQKGYGLFMTCISHLKQNLAIMDHTKELYSLDVSFRDALIDWPAF